MQLPDRMTDLLSMVRSGSITVKQAQDAQRSKALELNQSFHAAVCFHDAGDETYQGAFSGVALAHKDIFDMSGREPGCGVNSGVVAPQTVPAEVLNLLRQQGAMHMASLVMAPCAAGATAQNLHFPACVNPLDSLAAVGGSSSGSAVAVASGMSYASLGSDTSGSVRIPAASCGILGLKTTLGLVSTQGCMPLAPSLDTIGVLARYAEDAQCVLQAVLTEGARSQLVEVNPQQLRLKAWLPPDLDPEVARVMLQALDEFGVEVHINHLHGFNDLSKWANQVLCKEVSQTFSKALQNANAEPGVRSLAKFGVTLTDQNYQDAIHQRQKRCAEFLLQNLAEADLLIFPALQVPLPDWQEVEIGASSFCKPKFLGMFHYMGFVNYLGLPCLCLPAGRDRGGRPVAVQVLGRPLMDKALLEWAKSLESVWGKWSQRFSIH
jgi:aspartyl-tRNA(Asn)/glutamyl-tRNA(Gln) amidotransferase subunit A